MPKQDRKVSAGCEAERKKGCAQRESTGTDFEAERRIYLDEVDRYACRQYQERQAAAAKRAKGVSA